MFISNCLNPCPDTGRCLWMSGAPWPGIKPHLKPSDWGQERRQEKSFLSKRIKSNLICGISFLHCSVAIPAESYPLICLIPSHELHWPLVRVFWMNLLPPTHGVEQPEASFKPGNLQATPWGCRPKEGRWLSLKKSWWLSGPQKALSTREKQVIKKDNKINKSAFWVHINIVLISKRTVKGI